MKLLLVSYILFLSTLFAQNNIIENGNVLYFADKVIVKFKESGDRSFFKSSAVPTTVMGKLEKIGALNVEQTIVPTHQDAVNYGDVKNTFVVEYTSPYDPAVLSKKLTNDPGIEWAEPWYLYKISFEPNDPKFTDGTQWYLNKISAPQAWDLSTGDEDIVIAINDTGVDWDHPDLAANIWINGNELPDNGIDDDQNGYVDDFRGWDFGGNDGTHDNNPKEDAPTHGTYIAGLASATTNNGEGVSAIGYRCKIMPVKTSQENLGNSIIAYGREGIIYAAENGADIINCSWGGSPYSQALQDAITYATSLGALVVSSSDNENNIEPAYPSAYYGVLSVGGTDANDIRYNKSNYGSTVDVVAPATGATTGAGMYGVSQVEPEYDPQVPYIFGSSGTSLASPLTAGLAGLVIDRFPTFTPLQVAEQIRVNTDNIDDKNPSFAYYLGTGRINAFKTLNNTNSVSIRAEEFVYNDMSNGNGVTEPKETFSLGVSFKNYLNPASNVQITLESRSEFVTITQSGFNISSIGMMAETNNYSAPFTFTIAENIPVNEDVELLLKLNDGNGYDDYQLIRTKFNTTYLTQDGNDLALTIASEGNLGFNDYGQQPTEGDGLFFENGSNLLFEGALIYGSSRNMVMDAAHVNYLNDLSQDFESVIPFSLSTPGAVSDQQGFAVFNDNGASQNMSIETELHSYSFSQEEYDNFVILRYMFHNNADTTVNTFHAGLFFDLDLNDFDDDHTSWDTEDNFGYAYDEDPTSGKIDDYIGVALISDANYGYRAMSNSGNNPIGGVSLNPKFDEDEKWLAIASATTIRDYGPGDIAFSVSGGPYTIEPGGYQNVVFAVAGANSLDELRTAILSSRQAYGMIPTSVEKNEEELPSEFSLSQNYPNPFNPSTTIKFTVPQGVEKESAIVKLMVYDVLGRETAVLVNDKLSSGSYQIEFNAGSLTSGVYFYTLTVGSYSESKKMMLIK